MLIPGAAYAQVNLILDNATNTGAQTQLDINHS